MSASPVHRRQLHRLLLGCGAALAVPRLNAQGRVERARVTIAVDGRTALAQLPLTVAEQLDYFRTEGVEVEFIDLPGNTRAQQAVLAGSADMVSDGFENLLTPAARARGLQSLAQIARAPQVAVGVSTRALGYFRALPDLRGRRIGVIAPGSASDLVANLLLARAGLRPPDVGFVGVGTITGALTAVRTGQVDAISHVDPLITMLEQRGELRIISDTRTLKGTLELFGGPMPSTGLAAPADYIQRHPGTCQAVVNAVVHALKWLQTAGPSDIIKTVPDTHMLADRALYLAAFMKVREAISVDGLMPADGPATAARALALLEPAGRAERVDLARTFSNDFARRAKDRFKA